MAFSDRTNTDRAMRAFRAAIRYQGDEQLDILESVDDAHQLMGDLLGDLRHLADRLGVDFTAASDRAFRHYTAEVDEDEVGEWGPYGFPTPRRDCGAVGCPGDHPTGERCARVMPPARGGSPELDHLPRRISDRRMVIGEVL